MSAFGPSDLVLQANVGTVAAPVWINVGPCSQQSTDLVGEATSSVNASPATDLPGLRWSTDGWHSPTEGAPTSGTLDMVGGLGFGSTGGRYKIPAVNQYLLVPYLYATSTRAYYDDSATLVIQRATNFTGCPLGPNGKAAPFAPSSYRQVRWHWNSAGTFATPPQIKAVYDYKTAIATFYSRGTYDDAGASRPDPTWPTDGSGSGGGHYDANFNWIPDPPVGFCYDSGGVARSLVKANAHGSFGSPSGGPAGVPSIADGQNGAAVPPSGGWLSTWQGLSQDWDYVQHPSTPGGSGDWYFMLALFASSGVGSTPSAQGIYQPVYLCLDYGFA